MQPELRHSGCTEGQGALDVYYQAIQSDLCVIHINFLTTGMGKKTVPILYFSTVGLKFCS